jgi:hypothetical protein
MKSSSAPQFAAQIVQRIRMNEGTETIAAAMDDRKDRYVSYSQTGWGARGSKKAPPLPGASDHIQKAAEHIAKPDPIPERDLLEPIWMRASQEELLTSPEEIEEVPKLEPAVVRQPWGGGFQQGSGAEEKSKQQKQPTYCYVCFRSVFGVVGGDCDKCDAIYLYKTLRPGTAPSDLVGKKGKQQQGESSNEKRPIAQLQISRKNAEEEEEVDEAAQSKEREEEAAAQAAEDAKSSARIERELELRVAELKPKWRAEEDKRWRDTQLEMKEGERRFDEQMKDRKDNLDELLKKRERDLVVIQEDERAEAARRKRLADEERSRRLAEEHELAEEARREQEEEERLYREGEEKKARKIAKKVGDLVISGCSVAGVGSDHITKMGTYLLQETMHDLRPVYKCREHYLFYVQSNHVWSIGYRIGYSGNDNLEAPTEAVCPDQIKGLFRAAAVDDGDEDDEDDRVEYPFIEVEPLKEVNRRVAAKAKKAGDVVLLGLSNDVEQVKWMGVYGVTGHVYGTRPTYFNFESTSYLYFDEAIPGWRVAKEVGLEESPLSVTTVANTPELNKASWTLTGGKDEGLDPRLKVLGVRMLEQQIEALVRAADMVTIKGLKKGGKKGHPQGRCVLSRACRERVVPIFGRSSAPLAISCLLLPHASCSSVHH